MLVLLKLILSHLLLDFVLQSGKTVEGKKKYLWKSSRLHWHCILHALVPYLLIAQWSKVWIILFLYITHLLIDGWKARQKNNLLYFVADQLLHIAVLITVAILLTYPDTPWLLWIKNAWGNTRIWAIVTGYLIVLFPTAYFMQYATRHWRNDLIRHNAPLMKDSLRHAGKWIGMLERAVILTCILTTRYEGIGILIAAKSILRFNDLKGEHSQRQTEYILIGTLLSFISAIATGLLIRMLMQAS